ncbi:tRNA-modifying protein YgfZ [Pseudoalteromonas sp. SSM20]
MSIMVLANRIAEKIVVISGQDRKSYLHGQVTQDLNLLNESTFLWSGHCNAKGKLWSVHKLIASDESYLLLASESEANQSFSELKKYGVFSKAEFELSETLHTIGLIAQSTSEIESLLSISFGERNLVSFDLGYALQLANGLVELVIAEDKLAALESKITIEAHENDWLAATIKAGLPRLSAETLDEFVPQMVNLQAIGGISFNKGCYTGQETVARMKYLGKNKRAMYSLFAKEQTIESASEVEIQLGENWRRAGKITNIAVTAEGTFVQAVLPNDTSEQAQLRIKDLEESHLCVTPLPYTLED